MIVWVNIVLNVGLLLTVTDISTTCEVVKVSYIMSVDGIELSLYSPEWSIKSQSYWAPVS